MSKRTFITVAILVLALLVPLLLASCGDSDPELTRTEKKTSDESVDVPRKWDADEYTKYYVKEAINRYESEGLDSTVAYYNSEESVDGQWYVFIVNQEDVIIAHAPSPGLVGRHASEAVGPNNYPAGEAVTAVADEDGGWFDYTFRNPATGGVETKHSWVIEYDGLKFGSGWYEPGPSKADNPAYTQVFVQSAINLYDAVGLQDTVAYYNSEESVDGQWYVFIVNQENVIIAHAPSPGLVGSHASEAVGPNNYPAGEAVTAVADEDGGWFDYTFRNPATGGVETKHSWVIEYGGLKFGSGWYEPGPSKADNPAYTQVFVQSAINLYDAVGLDSTVAYYNSEESVDGQWYVFIVNQENVIIAHAPSPGLVGRHASEAVGPNNYPAGEAVTAVADEDGGWFDYTFRNPATGGIETKHSWVIEYGGLKFGSGWYEPGPSKADNPAYTQVFVQSAINLYDAVGLDSTVAYYNSEESVDGQWYVFIVNQENVIIAHAPSPGLVGRHASEAVGPNNYPAGEAVTAVADEDGGWFDYTFRNPATGGIETKHSWVIEYGGLKFGSGWYEPGPSKADNPAYTQVFVQSAINLYDAVGLDSTVAYYNSEESVDGQWYVFIVNQEGYTISHHNEMFRNRDPSERVDSTGYFYSDDLLSATEAGRWVDYALLNPETGDEGQKHTWAVRYDGLIFASGWYEPRQ